MNVLQRFTATFSQSLDRAVGQLENHDAVALAALRQVRASAANAKVRLAAVERDREALAAKLDSLQQLEAKWADRAVNVAGDDEAKALECLRRRQQCRAQIEATAQALADYDARIAQLSRSVAAMEERLQTLNHERNVLRTRDSVARAQKALMKLQDDDCGALDAVYARWEARIVETEYCTNAVADEDPLAREFARTEEDEALRAELADMMASKDPAADRGASS